MLLSCVVLILGLSSVFSSNLIPLLATMMYVSFFEIGLGPIPWLIIPEVCFGPTHEHRFAQKDALCRSRHLVQF
jgi:hypothetical protein|tara:strand:- start:487 stop:708 length:222 start_codon:yes stop_codon:yes gene_type:complete